METNDRAFYPLLLVFPISSLHSDRFSFLSLSQVDQIFVGALAAFQSKHYRALCKYISSLFRLDSGERSTVLQYSCKLKSTLKATLCRGLLGGDFMGKSTRRKCRVKVIKDRKSLIFRKTSTKDCVKRHVCKSNVHKVTLIDSVDWKAKSTTTLQVWHLFLFFRLFPLVDQYESYIAYFSGVEFSLILSQRRSYW